MSEDKTRILGDEEPTQEQEDKKAATTNPMLEAILAKLNSLAERVDEGFARVDSRFDAIEKRMGTIERKFSVLAIESIDIKAIALDHETRLVELERKAS